MKRAMRRYDAKPHPCASCGKRIVGLWPRGLCYECWLEKGRPS